MVIENQNYSEIQIKGETAMKKNVRRRTLIPSKERNKKFTCKNTTNNHTCSLLKMIDIIVFTKLNYAACRRKKLWKYTRRSILKSDEECFNLRRKIFINHD